MRRTLIMASELRSASPHDAHVDRDRAASFRAHHERVDLDILDSRAMIEKEAADRKRRLRERAAVAQPAARENRQEAWRA